MIHDVFVRAKTSDNRWASVNAADLDERSFRLFVLQALAESGVFTSVERDVRIEFSTPLTKAQCEDY